MRIFLLAAMFLNITFSFAQYDKAKLTGILTNGSSKTWTAKGVNIDRPEKTLTFNKDMTVRIEKDNGKGGISPQVDKWSVSSADNIRWFITIGNQNYETIVSYAKNGSQYIKLTHQAGSDKAAGYYEINLLPK